MKKNKEELQLYDFETIDLVQPIELEEIELDSNLFDFDLDLTLEDIELEDFM